MNKFRPKKFNNLDEIAQFLERYKLPKLTQKEIDNLNNHICFLKMEIVIQNICTSDS